jgi:hypothetical protein
MRVKVRGGTVQHGDPPLCSSCRHAIIIKGSRLGEEFGGCGVRWTPRRIPFPVTSCTEYVHRALPSIQDMEKIAWVIRVSSSGNRIGFVKASELTEDERHVLEED